MIQSFDGLRHESVISRDNEHDDIGHIRAAGTHCGECLMTRSIDESNGFSVQVHHGSTDILGDSAGFAACHVGFADRILKRSLSVVDVSHEGHDRTARYKILFFIDKIGIFRIILMMLCFRSIFRTYGQFDSAFFREFDSDFRRDSLIDACENVHLHQSADDFIRFFAESFRKAFHHDGRSDGGFFHFRGVRSCAGISAFLLFFPRVFSF